MMNQHEEETKSAQSSFAESKVTVMEGVDDWKLRQWMKCMEGQELPRVIACSDDESSEKSIE